jgi:site-specific DNA-methyltransferase (adenine-specific)
MDSIIPFDELWKQYNRITKKNAAIVLTACQPFTSALLMSNPKQFKYEWLWKKNQNSNFQQAKRQPLRVTESALVFYREFPTHNPQGLIKLDKPIITKNRTYRRLNHLSPKNESYLQEYTNYPKNIIEIDCERGVHPTHKPWHCMSILSEHIPQMKATQCWTTLPVVAPVLSPV